MEMEKKYLVKEMAWNQIQHNHYKHKHITLMYILKTHSLTRPGGSYCSI